MKFEIILFITILFFGCCTSTDLLKPTDPIQPQPDDPIPPQPDPEPTQICTDSDNGIDYSAKGTVTRGTYTATDYCSASTPKIVSVCYCKSDDTVGSEDYSCPNTCSDGKCIVSSTPDEFCTTDSGCGYRKRCNAGKCESVQCTSDSQCTGCRRCFNYNCVHCGYGASG